METSSPNTHATITPSPVRISPFRYLSTLYPIRAKLQKMEFAILWIIIADAAIFQAVISASALYTKLSFFSRAAAYSVDFANAVTKYNLSSSSKKSASTNEYSSSNVFTLPVWLVMHHFGVLGMHLFSVFYLGPKTPIELFVWALASQSSHNTWTKKISLVLYWGNVLVGVLAGSSYGCFLYDGGAGAAALLFVICVVVTCTGIVLLVGGSVAGSHFFVSFETRKDTKSPKSSTSPTPTMTKKHMGARRNQQKVTTTTSQLPIPIMTKKHAGASRYQQKVMTATSKSSSPIMTKKYVGASRHHQKTMTAVAA